MISIPLFLVAVVLGFVLQSVLSGGSRMVFDLGAGLIGGLLITGFSIFYPAGVIIGIFARMAITGHIHCSGLMIIYIIVGMAVGFLVF